MDSISSRGIYSISSTRFKSGESFCFNRQGISTYNACSCNLRDLAFTNASSASASSCHLVTFLGAVTLHRDMGDPVSSLSASHSAPWMTPARIPLFVFHPRYLCQGPRTIPILLGQNRPALDSILPSTHLCTLRSINHDTANYRYSQSSYLRGEEL